MSSLSSLTSLDTVVRCTEKHGAPPKLLSLGGSVLLSHPSSSSEQDMSFWGRFAVSSSLLQNFVTEGAYRPDC